MNPAIVDLDTSLDPQAVRDQLARILISPDFNVPRRIAGFLTFVVEETLAGRVDRLKAFAIAVQVFGRRADFDAMNDPVVRIEAGRLRRALERYYLLSGGNDPVVIDVPKGAYTPTFARRDEWEPVAASSLPESSGELAATLRGSRVRRWRFALIVGSFAVAVLGAATLQAQRERQEPEEPRRERPEITLVVSPFSNLAGPGGAPFSAGIFEEILTQLARFRELRVIGAHSNLPLQKTFSGPPQTVQYRLEGSVRGGQQLRVTARLIDVETSRIIWSQIYDRDLTEARGFEIETEIAAKVAIALTQPSGAIFASAARAPLAREIRADGPIGDRTR